jgi:hypothetical protein
MDSIQVLVTGGLTRAMGEGAMVPTTLEEDLEGDMAVAGHFEEDPVVVEIGAGLADDTQWQSGAVNSMAARKPRATTLHCTLRGEEGLEIPLQSP